MNNPEEQKREVEMKKNFIKDNDGDLEVTQIYQRVNLAYGFCAEIKASVIVESGEVMHQAIHVFKYEKRLKDTP